MSYSGNRNLPQKLRGGWEAALLASNRTVTANAVLMLLAARTETFLG
jgi:hypothetical protein